MQLNNDQKAKIIAWAKEGAGLAEIQRRLAADFDVKLTYMETRMLVDDLKIGLRDAKAKPPAAPIGALSQPGGGKAAQEPDEDEALPLGAEDESLPAGGVSVEVDRIMKPNSVVSGTVTFSDGIKGSWFVDAMGRLAISADKKNYRPTEQDLMGFRDALDTELRKRGL